MTFLKALKSLPPDLQEEAIEKIELFKQPRNHTRLKVHKLKGRLEGRYSFSVNYQTRMIFTWLKSDGHQIAYLLNIGNHDIYH